MVVVLLAMYMYNNYVSDLSGEIASKEVKEFNGELNALGKYFKQGHFMCSDYFFEKYLVSLIIFKYYCPYII